MKTVTLDESGMNWVKKRPGAYVFLSFMCLICFVIMISPLFSSVKDPAHDKTAFVLGLFGLLFLGGIGWVPVLIKNSKGSFMKLIPDEERLVIRKDGQEIMNAAWTEIRNVRFVRNGRNLVRVDFDFADADGRSRNCFLPLGYVDTEAIDEMVVLLKENWFDKRRPVKN